MNQPTRHVDNVLAVMAIAFSLCACTLDEGPEVRTGRRLEFLHDALTRWATEHGRLPTEQEGLRVMYADAPHVDEIDRDGWRNQIRYTVGARSSCAFAYSLGPNSLDEKGAGDDVRLPTSEEV